MADEGVAQAARENPGLAKGVNVVGGKVTYQPVAEATGQPYTELFDDARRRSVCTTRSSSAAATTAWSPPRYSRAAGRSVLVLERRDHVGGAAVSERPWPGVDARLSRYSYLVSLMPRALRERARADDRAAPALGLLLLAAAGRQRAARARRRAAARELGGVPGA